MLVLSVFLGNIYSHSLLIRENVYLLSIFIAFAYALTYESLAADCAREPKRANYNQFRFYVTMFIIVAVACFAALEVASSFYKMPFQYAGHCYNGAKEAKKCDAQPGIMERGK